MKRWVETNPLVFNPYQVGLDEAARRLTEWFVELKNLVITKKTITINPRKKPWFSKELEELKKSYVARKDPDDKRAARNKYFNRLKKEKRKFDRSIIEKNAKRGIWALVNKKGSGSTKKIELNHNGQVIRDPATVAVTFAKHFESKIEKLKKTPQLDRIFSLLKTHFETLDGSREVWDFHEVSVEEVVKILRSIPAKSSSGPDGISNRLIKDFEKSVIYVLTDIINMSLLSGKFPIEWRIA